MTDRPPSEADALDAYSEVVTRVADTLLPSIASIELMHRGGRRPLRQGGGSAVAVTPDGYLITSAHVVADTTKGRAMMTDGRALEYTRVGTDPLSDLAVLRTDGDELVAAEMGDADQLRTGQLVVAIGSPLGFAGSVSAGVVGALGRSLPTNDGRVGRVVDNVIQTDVALHPGNSGGALANGRAQVVGINTAVVGSIIGPGLGLAVPINAATKRIIGALMRHGRVRRGYLGIAGGLRPLPPRIAAQEGQSQGVEVSEVMPASPAARSRLRPGDIITRVDDVPIKGVGALQGVLTENSIGATLHLHLVRGGKSLQLEISPAELSS